MMFTDFSDTSLWRRGQDHGSVDDLGIGEARILWAMRRLALLQPLGGARCHAVHIALQQEFGDAGLGIEHLLRCWLVGLARMSRRRLNIGEPACPLVLPDEAALLGVLRSAGERDGLAGAALVQMTGSAAAADLEVLCASVRMLAQIP